MRVSRHLLILCFIPALTACSTLGDLNLTKSLGLGPVISKNEARAAIESEDFETLHAVCAGRTKLRNMKTNQNLFSDVCVKAMELSKERKDTASLKPLCAERKNPKSLYEYDTGCAALHELAREADDVAELQRLCKEDAFERSCHTADWYTTFPDLADPECDTLAERTKTARGSFFTARNMETEMLGDVAYALARCGEGETLFEHLAPIGDGYPTSTGVEMLLYSHAKGPETLAALDTYTRTNPGKAFLAIDEGARNTARHISQWLIKADGPDRCAALSKATQGAKETVRIGMMDYFFEEKCTQAAKIAESLLQSEEPYTRQLGCRALGAFGGSSSLAKMRIVAEGDTSYEVVEQRGLNVKVRHVADACQTGMSKIKLRN